VEGRKRHQFSGEYSERSEGYGMGPGWVDEIDCVLVCLTRYVFVLRRLLGGGVGGWWK